MHLHALICVREHVSDVILMLICMWGECVLLEVVCNLFVCVCVKFLTPAVSCAV